jgi:molecular chaperone GrpE
MMMSVDHERATASPGHRTCAVEDVEIRAALEHEVARLEAGVTFERERYLRTLADFDNFRRQVRRERARAELAKEREILVALLDVMDDFDRAMSHVGDASDAVADGLRLIRQRLDGVLRSNGVAVFESAGRPFCAGH